MEMKRRDSLTTSIAGTASLSLAATTTAHTAAVTFYDPCETVTLGKTGIKVSRVGLGTGIRGGRHQANRTRVGKERLNALARNSLARLKKKGLIRAHALPCHCLATLEASVNESWADALHARINPFAAKMDLSRIKDVPRIAPVLRSLRRRDKAVIGMKIAGEGTFRDSDSKRNESIKYVLESGCVDAMVVGFEKIRQADDFAARVRKVPETSRANRVEISRTVRLA